jgi:hypothetical protein
VVYPYVHVTGSVEEIVQRKATGVARCGTLFLVGHRPIDLATGAATAAAGQVQVSVGAARSPPSIRTGGHGSSPMTVRGRWPGTSVDAVDRASFFALA